MGDSENITRNQRYYLAHREKRLAYIKQYQSTRKNQKREYDKKRRAEKRDDLVAYDRVRYYSHKKYSIASVWNSARHRAKKRGIEFAIKVSDLPAVPDVCPILLIPLIRHFGKGGRPDSPSLDRIDSSRGYVPGNVAFISSLANRIKSNITLDQARRLVDYIERAHLPDSVVLD